MGYGAATLSRPATLRARLDAGQPYYVVVQSTGWWPSGVVADYAVQLTPPSGVVCPNALTHDLAEEPVVPPAAYVPFMGDSGDVCWRLVVPTDQRWVLHLGAPPDQVADAAVGTGVPAGATVVAEVMDAAGTVITTTTISPNQSVDVNLPATAGTYYLRLVLVGDAYALYLASYGFALTWYPLA